MTLVSCKPIGVIRMNDQGELDEKIIAVCISDPFYNGYEDISPVSYTHLRLRRATP